MHLLFLEGSCASYQNLWLRPLAYRAILLHSDKKLHVCQSEDEDVVQGCCCSVFTPRNHDTQVHLPHIIIVLTRRLSHHRT